MDLKRRDEGGEESFVKPQLLEVKVDKPKKYLFLAVHVLECQIYDLENPRICYQESNLFSFNGDLWICLVVFIPFNISPIAIPQKRRDFTMISSQHKKRRPCENKYCHATRMQKRWFRRSGTAPNAGACVVTVYTEEELGDAGRDTGSCFQYIGLHFCP